MDSDHERLHGIRICAALHGSKARWKESDQVEVMDANRLHVLHCYSLIANVLKRTSQKHCTVLFIANAVIGNTVSTYYSIYQGFKFSVLGTDFSTEESMCHV